MRLIKITHKERARESELSLYHTEMNFDTISNDDDVSFVSNLVPVSLPTTTLSNKRRSSSKEVQSSTLLYTYETIDDDNSDVIVFQAAAAAAADDDVPQAKDESISKTKTEQFEAVDTELDDNEKQSICSSDDGDCYLPDDQDDPKPLQNTEKKQDTVLLDDSDIEDYDNDKVFASVAGRASSSSSEMEIFDETDDDDDGSESKKSATSLDCGSLVSEYAVVEAATRAALINEQAYSVAQNTQKGNEHGILFSTKEKATVFEMLWWSDIPPVTSTVSAPVAESVSSSAAPAEDDHSQFLTPLGSPKDDIDVQTAASTPSKEEMNGSDTVRPPASTPYLTVPSLVGGENGSTNVLATLGNLTRSISSGFASPAQAINNVHLTTSTSSVQNFNAIQDDQAPNEDIEVVDDLASFQSFDHKNTTKEQDQMATKTTEKKSQVMNTVTSAFFGKFRKTSTKGSGSSSNVSPTDQETQDELDVPSGGPSGDNQLQFDDATIESNNVDLNDKEVTTKARHWLWCVILSGLIAIVIIVVLFVVYAFTA